MEEDKLKTNVQTENIEQKIETYFNRETLEILTDPLEISYYKNLQYDEIVDSELLGEFDKSGNYLINRDILLELVAVKKVIKESKDNKYILSAPVKDFNSLLFTLQIDDEEDKKVAVLKIIENDLRINGEKELLKTNIARYKDDNDIYFLTKVKKLFNVVDSDNDGKELNNEEFLKIILKKFKDFKLLKKQEVKFEENAKQYLEQIIEILNNNPGKFSEYILRKYNIFLEETKESIGKPKYYKNLKYKLDKLINETKKVVKDPIVESLIGNVRKQYLENAKKTQNEILEIKVATKPNIKEKPKEKKAETEKKIEKKKAVAKKAQIKKKAAKKDASKPTTIYKPSNVDNIKKITDISSIITEEKSKEESLKKVLLDAQLSATYKLIEEKLDKNQDGTKKTIVVGKIHQENQNVNEQTL